MRILQRLLLLGHLIVVTYGHPILKAPESVTGSWKGDVSLHCMYDPLRGYTQVLVKWLVQRGSDTVTIFLRDSSGDHIQQAKYRGRLNVRHMVSGDVSLQLSTLQMDDQSHYTCEVTWQTPDGSQAVSDTVIELRVKKYSSNLPITKTEVPTTVQSSSEDSSNLPITKTEVPTTVQSSLEATTTVISSFDRTTKENIASSGRGLPNFATILIISLCCMLVATIVYIIIVLCHKISRQGHAYEVNRVHARKTSNSGETMKVAIFTNECFGDEPALINDYSSEPCLDQEYDITTLIPQDHEVLATEDNSIC